LVVHLLEDTIGTNVDDMVDCMNKKINSIIGAMLMEEIYEPINVPSADCDSGGCKRRDVLRELVPMDNMQDFLASIFEESMLAIDPEADGDEVYEFRKKEFEGIVGMKLYDRGYLSEVDEVEEVDKLISKVAEKCWRILARNKMESIGLDINSPRLDLVWKVNPVGSMKHLLVTEKMGSKTFEAYRNACRGKQFTIDEYLAAAEEVHKKHGALVPKYLLYGKNDIVWEA
jgi:hypothetical protein